MSKFCTQCGAQMPDDNLFCTNCGAKFAPQTAPQNNAFTSNNTVHQNTVPPQPSAHIQQTFQPGGTSSYQQAAQNEFALGRQCMDAANPSRNYIQAINHLQKAVSMGVHEANIYMAIAYMSQAVEILKASVPQLAGMMSQMPMGNAPFAQTAVNNAYGANPQYRPMNYDSNQQSSTMSNAGKYAAAAALGAVAGSVMTDAANAGTASAQEHVQDAAQNYAQPIYGDAADSISSANNFIQDPGQHASDAASEYIHSMTEGAAGNDPSAAADPAAGLQAAEEPDKEPADSSADSSDENSADKANADAGQGTDDGSDGGFLDSLFSGDSDGGDGSDWF